MTAQGYIDFLRYKKVSIASFLILISLTIGAYFYRGGFNYSVDFTGGTQVLLETSKHLSSEAVKEALRAKGYQGVDTREFSANEVLVRLQEFSDDAQVGENIKNSLESNFEGVEFKVLQTDSVGPGVGATLRWDSIKAIAIGLILMLLYIAVRFQFAYSSGAVAALFHDILVICAFFLLTNREVSIDVIGAILAILGYSINDTIVIFTRIRENVKKLKGESIDKIVNISLSQTLRRTMLTSLSTALVVLAMIILGGETLRGLSLALLLGIIFGTYSSIYIASPVMLMLYKEDK